MDGHWYRCVGLGAGATSHLRFHSPGGNATCPGANQAGPCPDSRRAAANLPARTNGASIHTGHAGSTGSTRPRLHRHTHTSIAHAARFWRNDQRRYRAAGCGPDACRYRYWYQSDSPQAKHQMKSGGFEFRKLRLAVHILVCLVSVAGQWAVVLAQDPTPTLPPRPTIGPTLPPRPTIGPTLPPRPTVGPTCPPRPTLEPTPTPKPPSPPKPAPPSEPEASPTPQPTVLLPVSGGSHTKSSVTLLLALGLGGLVIVASLTLRRSIFPN